MVFRLVNRGIGTAAALLLIAALSPRARAVGMTQQESAERLKQTQVSMLRREPLEQRMIQRERLRLRNRGKRTWYGERMRPEIRPELPAADRGTGFARVEPRLRAASVPANHRINDPSGDSQSNTGQSELSIAAFGNNVVAAWNDGEGFNVHRSLQGYGYSTDGGTTWTDGGAVLTPAAGMLWTSDPVLTVNEKTGEFYFAGLIGDSANFGGTTNGVGVVKGTFVGGILRWQTPRIVRSLSSSFHVFDKEWLVADSLNNALYLTYTVFVAGGGDSIWFARSLDGGATWTNFRVVSSGTDAGYVQGSRPAVGPSGEVYVTWYAINLLCPYQDHFKVRKSTDAGVSFGAEIPAVALFSNFGSGAPGFNRANGITFPSIAVDRSNGSHRGRVYLAWNEGVSVFDDDLGGSNLVESESNANAAQADPFTMGQTVVGVIATNNDEDWYKFTGSQGQTAIVFLDSLQTATQDLTLALFCGDGTTRLAISKSGKVQDGAGSALTMFTLPLAGTNTYYVRVRVADPSDPSQQTGQYKLFTDFDAVDPVLMCPPVPSRARDHRDVFTSWSDNGVAWSTPVRVPDDPGYFDDWLPEVAVAANGKPYVTWFDWRDDPCGGASHIYVSRSDDGGSTWIGTAPVTDAQTAWSAVSSNIAPNQGDYNGLFANDSAVFAAWGDGRAGNPDAFMAKVPLLFTGALVALTSAQAAPDSVTLDWYAASNPGLTGTVYRRTETTGWSALAPFTADGTGRIRYVDRAVQPGDRFGYRLGYQDQGSEQFSSTVWVDVPRLQLGIDVWPNPAPGDVFVRLSLPDVQPATVELLDVTGRRVHSITYEPAGSGPQGPVNVTSGAQIPAGIYVIRVAQAGKSATSRVTLVR